MKKRFKNHQFKWNEYELILEDGAYHYLYGRNTTDARRQFKQKFPTLPSIRRINRTKWRPWQPLKELASCARGHAMTGGEKFAIEAALKQLCKERDALLKALVVWYLRQPKPRPSDHNYEWPADVHFAANAIGAVEHETDKRLRAVLSPAWRKGAETPAGPITTDIMNLRFEHSDDTPYEDKPRKDRN